MSCRGGAKCRRVLGSAALGGVPYKEARNYKKYISKKPEKLDKLHIDIAEKEKPVILKRKPANPINDKTICNTEFIVIYN